LVNTHNLTTDIDHDSITNTHNLTTDIDHDQLTNTHNLTTDIDHGGINGLGDDDHTQYVLASGSRAFSGVVSGVTPTSTSHLATKGYVDSMSQGLDWQDSVLDRYDPTAGLPAEVEGNRYLSTATANGWTANNIYEWSGSAWDETSASEGMAVWVEDEDKLYVYNGSAWVKFGSTIDHGTLSGLGDDDHTQYLLAAGSRALTGDWDIGLGRTISAEKIQARSSLGLSLYDDGGKGIFIEDGGNVGIGTTNPGSKLAVSTETDFDGIYLNDLDGTVKGRMLRSATGDAYIQLYDSSPSVKVTITSNGGSYLNGGSVGIGTASPAQLLHLNKDTGAYSPSSSPTPHLYIRNTTAQSEGYAGLLFQSAPDSGDDGQGWIGLASHTGGYGSMVFGTRDSGGFTEKMRISSNGNVGIGTTEPSKDLVVEEDDGFANIRIETTDATSSGVNLELVTTDKSWYMGERNDGWSSLPSDTFYISDDSSPRFVIDSSGNVGIGDTTPDDTLTVIGGTQNIRVGANDANHVHIGRNSSTGDFEIRHTLSGASDKLVMQVKENSTTPNIVFPNGNVGIGVTNPSYDLQVGANDDANHQIAVWSDPTSSTTELLRLRVISGSFADQYYIACYGGDPAISLQGGLKRVGSAAQIATFNGCDRRIKTDIQDANEDILSKILNVRIVNYKMKGGDDSSYMGVIAQELNDIFPEMVNKSDDGEGEDLPEGTNPWTIDETWNYKLIKSIQDQQNIIEDQKSEIDSLKETVQQLISRVESLEGA